MALAASDAVARSAKHHLMFKRAGVEYGAATEFASRIADDLYARLGEHVIVKVPKWCMAAIRRIQASWMGGVVVAGHLEAVSLDEQRLTYEELDDAYEMLHAGPSFDFLPSDEIVRDLELDVSATRRAAGMVALDALPDLIRTRPTPRACPMTMKSLVLPRSPPPGSMVCSSAYMLVASSAKSTASNQQALSSSTHCSAGRTRE